MWYRSWGQVSRLVALEPRQADLLGRICGGSLLRADDLRASGAFHATGTGRGGQADQSQRDLLDDGEREAG